MSQVETINQPLQAVFTCTARFKKLERQSQRKEMKPGKVLDNRLTEEYTSLLYLIFKLPFHKGKVISPEGIQEGHQSQMESRSDSRSLQRRRDRLKDLGNKSPEIFHFWVLSAPLGSWLSSLSNPSPPSDKSSFYLASLIL